MSDLLIDTSVDQGAIDFAALKGHVVGIYPKATEGITYTDAQYRRSRDIARTRGIRCGAYHFVRMNDDGALQAKHFLSQRGGACTLVPMVDIEEASFDGVTLPLETKIARFSHLISAIDRTLPIGKRCIIYTNYDTWTTYMGNTDAFSGHLLWVAQSEDPRKSGLFGGWKSAAIWQYSIGRVPGISGDVDLDKILVPISMIYL